MDRMPLVLLVASSVVLLLQPPPALAHAILLRATPAADSTLAGPDVPFELRFNSRIDARRSRLSILLPGGKLRPLSIEQQTSADTLRSKAAHLEPGVYRLQWQVLASDGHVSRGEVAFTIK